MEYDTLIKRRLIFTVAFSLSFFILMTRFFYLQIYKQDKYIRESEKNRIREVMLQPTRGLIYDCDGEILVDNIPSYSVYAIPFEVQNADTVLELLSEIIDIPMIEMKSIIAKHKGSLFSPVKLKRMINFDMLSKIEESRLELPGIIYDIEPRRFYPSVVRAPHLFGYLGEISTKELEDDAGRKYQPGDIIGKKGLERVYDEQLKGVRGYRYIEVDALGREVRSLNSRPEILPIPGKNLHLSIDKKLQSFLESRMDSLRGGAVVVDCDNGEILALVSKPDYDPEMFTKPITQDLWDRLLNDPDKPLYDRMVQSIYPPGSTYKLVLATAALETGTIDQHWRSTCFGTYRFGRRNFDCWKLEGHGELDLLGAIEQSCNVYFYKLGLRLGLDYWSEFSTRLRMGIKTDIDLYEENSGIIPSTSYFDMKYGQGKWSKGLVLNLAVGQGDMLITPLQLAALAMIMANKGVYHPFHLVRYIEDPIDMSRHYTAIDSIQISGISKPTYDIVRQGMYGVVNGANGTARVCRFTDIEVAGKTGTAQNPHGEPHAWFIGFVLNRNPKIAFCVLVENGGSGSADAAPIARDIIRTFYTK
ncbi:penicillin-binding protein 2 [candidate division KSB1 bacterium]|nr:penicillin-binding protein 2 [candidate division KSB1 bacterium]